jgi:pSer/pThr/pTyr-binding forkhead associated (FHA) protein
MTSSCDGGRDRNSLCLKNRDTGEVFIPGAEKITIGRNGQCDLVISNDPTVSRTHANMVIIGETASIRDLESSNGVYVNGKKVATIALLYSGDEIQLGATKFVMVPFAMLTSLERQNGLVKKDKPAGSTKITQPLMDSVRPKHIELLTNRKTSQ